VPESRNASKLRGFAIERRVVVGSPNARLSRFVAAAVTLARRYRPEITVGYRGREADAKRVLESLMVPGKSSSNWVYYLGAFPGETGLRVVA
jgi:hypothetical protein